MLTFLISTRDWKNNNNTEQNRLHKSVIHKGHWVKCLIRDKHDLVENLVQLLKTPPCSSALRSGDQLHDFKVLRLQPLLCLGHRHAGRPVHTPLLNEEGCQTRLYHLLASQRADIILYLSRKTGKWKVSTFVHECGHTQHFSSSDQGRSSWQRASLSLRSSSQMITEAVPSWAGGPHGLCRISVTCIRIINELLLCSWLTTSHRSSSTQEPKPCRRLTVTMRASIWCFLHFWITSPSFFLMLLQATPALWRSTVSSLRSCGRTWLWRGVLHAQSQWRSGVSVTDRLLSVSPLVNKIRFRTVYQNILPTVAK